MKLRKLLAATTALLLVAGTGAFAQDDDWGWGDGSGGDGGWDGGSGEDDDFGSFGGDDDSFASFGDDDGFASFDDDDDFGSFGDDDGFGSFGSFGDDSSGSSLPVTFTGDFSLDTRYYFAKDDSDNFLGTYFDDAKATTGTRIGKKDSSGDKVGVTDATLKAFPKAKLGVEYSGSMSDALLTLNLTKETLTDYKEDIIDELILRGYFLDRHLIVEAGKMKVVWGKGDKLHVLDNFNADDYTDFIVPDYIDRRISTPMLRGVYSFDNALAIEGVFTPFLPKDRFAEEGMWVPGAYAKLSYTIRNVLEQNIKSGATSLVDAADFDADDLYPDVYNLKYAQAGLHVTGTAGTVDWGLSYYFGRYKQPSANVEDIATLANITALMQKAAAAGDTAELARLQALAQKAQKSGIPFPELKYDRKQTFGVEAATVVGRFNLRAEAGYNLTKDTAGDDPWVHNNSISWLGGFDIDLPVSNINLNVQETGTYILANNKIKDGAFKGYDVDYDPKDRYTNDKLVVNISDSWMHDKVKPEITVMWGIERGDLVIQPKIAYNPTPELTFTLNGMYIFCRDEYSEFAYWKNNNFVNLGVRYQF